MHENQISEKIIGAAINFHLEVLRDGIDRVVNELVAFLFAQVNLVLGRQSKKRAEGDPAGKPR